MQVAVLESLQVGTPRRYGAAGAADPMGRPWESSFFRAPSAQPRWLHTTHLEGNAQADTKNHGRPDQAVLLYAAAHYPAWRAELGRPENLEILCGRCERDDPHSGARNRGQGRQRDRDAYRSAAERAELVRLGLRYRDERASCSRTAQRQALLRVVYDVIKEENPTLTIEQVGRALEPLYLPGDSARR